MRPCRDCDVHTIDIAGGIRCHRRAPRPFPMGQGNPHQIDTCRMAGVNPDGTIWPLTDGLGCGEIILRQEQANNDKEKP